MPKVYKQFEFGICYDSNMACLCPCHERMFYCAHCAPCCDRTYEKYSDECWLKAEEYNTQGNFIMEPVSTLTPLQQKLKAYFEKKNTTNKFEAE